MLVGGSSRIHHTQQTNSSIDDQSMDNYLSQDRNKISSRLIQEVASSALIDSLADQWWSLNLADTVINDLLENLIPLVVLACEKVIHEADENNLIATTSSDRTFNPINRLASFLMRNNPKYMHYSSLSPYHYTMKSLLNTKKIQVLKVYGEEETQLRTLLKQRQDERKQIQDTVIQEDQRRKDLLKMLFSDWNVPERGWIQSKLINNMLEQYNENEKQADLKVNLPLIQSHRVHLGTFTQNFLNGLNNYSSDKFNKIVDKQRTYAQTYADTVQEYELNLLLQRLFSQLDDKQIGFLLRKNVMDILKTFYNILDEQNRTNVNQPDQWPVVKKQNFDETIEENVSEETDDVEEDKPNESQVTNDQEIKLTDENDKKNEEGEEQVDEDQQQNEDEQKTTKFQLKEASAYDASYRFTKERKPTYNLEHFDTIDHNKAIPFDEQLINGIQFSSLFISFSGLTKNDMIISALIDYFRSNYKETHEDIIQKKSLLQQRRIDTQQRLQCDLLFEKLNTSCTGYIKLKVLASFIKQYKDGTLTEQIEQFLQTFDENLPLNNKQFFEIIMNVYQTINESAGGNEKFDDFLKYIESQQPTFNTSDRARIQTRNQWLKSIRDISFRSSAQLYKEVMDIIQKDSDTFGASPLKHLSIYIALLDNDKNELRYVATTNDQTDLLLGKTLRRDQGISFQILDSGKWAYVNQTKNHTRLHFFNSNVKTHSGSFVLIPLKTVANKYSNGLLGIDTIRDKREKAFLQHEVQFYEGIAAVLADKFNRLRFDENIQNVFRRFIYWIQQRCKHVSTIDYYTYEPISLNAPSERILKHVSTYSNGNLTSFSTAQVINSSEQIFKYHLVQAAVTCQSIMTSFLNQTHMIHTMRGRDEYCFALIDVNFGEQTNISNEDKQTLTSMFNCINQAIEELEGELFDEKLKQDFNYENKSNVKRLHHLFDRIFYMDICHNIKHLSIEKQQEIIDNKTKLNDQSKQILSTISRIIAKKDLSPSDYAAELFPAMIGFDPTSDENSRNDAWNRVEQTMKNINQSTTWQQTSPDIIKLFYDWLQLTHELHQFSKTQ